MIPEDEHEKTELIIEHHEAEESIRHLRPKSFRSPRNSTAESSHRSEYKPSTDHFSVLKSLAHGPRTRTDENFRAPIIWAYNLREAVSRESWPILPSLQKT